MSEAKLAKANVFYYPGDADWVILIWFLAMHFDLIFSRFNSKTKSTSINPIRAQVIAYLQRPSKFAVLLKKMCIFFPPDYQKLLFFPPFCFYLQVVSFLASSPTSLAPERWGFWSLAWTVQEKPPFCTGYRWERLSPRSPVSLSFAFPSLHSLMPVIPINRFISVKYLFICRFWVNCSAHTSAKWIPCKLLGDKWGRKPN